MLRKLLGLFAVAVLLCVGVVMADEVKGKVMKVDVDKKTLTVSVDGTDKTFDVSDDCKFPAGGKGGTKAGTLQSFAKSVEKAGDKGVKATLTTEKKAGKDVVTEIKREPGKAKDKTDK